jgi:hypothetical protein
MPRLVLPGPRTGLAYIWAIVLSPLLLLAASVALLVMGFWRHVDSVAAIGAIGVVASLVLPRMRGAFEIGPAGIKGDLDNEVYRDVIEKARDRGWDADRAIELASDTTRSPLPPHLRHSLGVLTELRHARWLPSADPVLRAPRYTLADALASDVVEESERHRRQVAAIVERVAGEKGWEVTQDERVPPPPGERWDRVFDFVLGTPRGQIFMDVVIVRDPENLRTIVAAVNAVLRDRERLAALVVIPDVRFPAPPTRGDPEVVRIGQLERRLREISADGTGLEND